VTWLAKYVVTHGKALNPSMGAPTPLIDGLGRCIMDLIFDIGG